ncbi:MAG TPA: tetratricopeptide repeat protein [Kofleriaceae bacterium]|nr:tetratricopeptide repeat protein [Kofleriaceae bacterium]
MPRDLDPLAETQVNTPSDAGEAKSDPALDQTAADSLVGRASFSVGEQLKIGRFLALEKLGEGGMGVVIAAYDPQLDRKVAIKMMHDHVSELQGSRLAREAKAMAQLNHPNVLTVHDTGLYGDRLYIAMELVDGTTLAKWLRAKPRSQAEIFDVIMQAGRGLAAAHAVGLVHRDFKPDNVLVGNDGRVRVSDFGLVSSSGEAPTNDGKKPKVDAHAALTQTGAVMGTPLYMAPEQHAGKVADAKADQFSFAVTLWQALCDEMPYGADSYEALVANVTGGKLRAIPRGVRVPAKIKEILARGLESDPAKRFGSMKELLAALDRARRPNRQPLIIAGAVVAGLAIGGGVLLMGGRHQAATEDVCGGGTKRVSAVWDDKRRASLASAFSAIGGDDVWKQLDTIVSRYAQTWALHHRDICSASLVRHEQSSELYDLRMRCMDGRLADFDALLTRIATTKKETRFKTIDAVAALPDFTDCDDSERLRAAIPLPNDAAVRAKIADIESGFTEAVSYDRTGDAKTAKSILDPLVPKAKELGYAPLDAKLVLLRAGLELRAGDLETAAASYRESAEVAARARDDVRIAQSWIDLMNVLGLQGKYADALALEPIARTSTERVSDEPRLVARFANTLAGIYLAQGKYPDARREYEKALEAVRKDRPDSDLLAPALGNMALALWYTGDMPGAQKFYADARDRAIENVGPKHPTLAYLYRNIGDLAAATNDIDTALENYKKSLAIFEGTNGPDHIDVAIALEPLSYAYARKGDVAKSREAGLRALKLREAKYGPEHPTIANTLNSLADAEVMDGRPESLTLAIAYLDRSIAIQEKAFGTQHPKLPDSLDRLGNAQLKAKKYADAVTTFQRSLAIKRKTMGPTANDVALVETELGQAALMVKKYSVASDAYIAAEGIFRGNNPKDPNIAIALLGRANVEAAQGHRAKAVELAKQARELAEEPVRGMVDAFLAGK